jgi:hypothetical protein
MKFITTFTFQPDPEARAEGIARFQKTGGQPPEGITLLGRWTKVDMSGGVVLLEIDDPKKLAEFAYGWSDLMTLSTSPVLEDADMHEVLQGAMP